MERSAAAAGRSVIVRKTMGARRHFVVHSEGVDDGGDGSGGE